MCDGGDFSDGDANSDRFVRARAPPTDAPTSSPTPRSPVWKFLFALGVKMGYPIRHIDLASGTVFLELLWIWIWILYHVPAKIMGIDLD